MKTVEFVNTDIFFEKLKNALFINKDSIKDVWDIIDIEDKVFDEMNISPDLALLFRQSDTHKKICSITRIDNFHKLFL